jgi:hypothetical protein
MITRRLLTVLLILIVPVSVHAGNKVINITKNNTILINLNANNKISRLTKN